MELNGGDAWGRPGWIVEDSKKSFGLSCKNAQMDHRPVENENELATV